MSEFPSFYKIQRVICIDRSFKACSLFSPNRHSERYIENCRQQKESGENNLIGRKGLDLINILVLELEVVIGTTIVLLVEAACETLVEADIVGELAVGLEEAGLVRHVLEDDIGLVVLVVAQADEHDVAAGDPDLLVHLAADMAQPLAAVDAQGLAAAVPEHAQHLRVLLAVLLEHELALLVVRLVLAALAVLASLALVLRHGEGEGEVGGEPREGRGARDGCGCLWRRALSLCRRGNPSAEDLRLRLLSSVF
jgi:hypothetical protein